MTLQNKKGQGTLEFALVIVVVVAALIAMQIYMKRAFEGKLKKNTDSIGEQFEGDETYVNRTTSVTGKTVQYVGEGTPVSGGTVGAGETYVDTESYTQSESGSE